LKDYIIGVDLGQSQDYSALTVLRRQWWRPGEKPTPEKASLWHEIPMLVRWELGTEYPRIVQNIVEIYKQVWSRSKFNEPPALVVDQGGPGRPVMDLLRKVKLPPDGSRMMPVGVMLTGGASVSERTDDMSVPQRDVCSALVVAAQSGDLKVASSLELADEFEKELQAFGYDIKRKSGKLRYEAQGTAHDDLVLSASLALWYSTNKLPHNFFAVRPRQSREYDQYNPMAREK
jgi:hypothetical protein